MPDWLITGCSELLTLRGSVPRRGRALAELGLIRDGALLVHGDRITAIGPRRRIERLKEARRAVKLDFGGRVVLPGFVDSHTHLIFPSSRAAEYEQRISGKTYAQIARAGGGIHSTVKNLRRTSSNSLLDSARSASSAIRRAWDDDARSQERLRPRLEERTEDPRRPSTTASAAAARYRPDISRRARGSSGVSPAARGVRGPAGKALDSDGRDGRDWRSSAMSSAIAARSRWRRRGGF